MRPLKQLMSPGHHHGGDTARQVPMEHHRGTAYTKHSPTPEGPHDSHRAGGSMGHPQTQNQRDSKRPDVTSAKGGGTKVPNSLQVCVQVQACTKVASNKLHTTHAAKHNAPHTPHTTHAHCVHHAHTLHPTQSTPHTPYTQHSILRTIHTMTPHSTPHILYTIHTRHIGTHHAQHGHST